MRKNIEDIMKQLGCSEEHAGAVENRMVIDFSECTKKEFKAEVKYANAILLVELEKS